MLEFDSEHGERTGCRLVKNVLQLKLQTYKQLRLALSLVCFRSVWLSRRALLITVGLTP